MVLYTMPFELQCDSCDFNRQTGDETGAYADARDHESDHPSHFVLITTID